MKAQFVAAVASTALLGSVAATSASAVVAAHAAGKRPKDAVTAVAAPQTQVLRLRVVFDVRASHNTDVGKNGPSAGDQFVYSATLHHAGHVVGRLEGVTTAADNRYQGDVSTQYFVLRHGTVAVVGGGASGAPGVGRPDSEIFDAIVGGTGRYVDAGGWVSAHDLGPKSESVTLHFR